MVGGGVLGAAVVLDGAAVVVRHLLVPGPRGLAERSHSQWGPGGGGEINTRTEKQERVDWCLCRIRP